MSPIDIGRSDHRKMILNPEMRFSHMSALKCDRPLCQMNTELCKLSSLKLAALDIGDGLQVPTYLVSQPLTASHSLSSLSIGTQLRNQYPSASENLECPKTPINIPIPASRYLFSRTMVQMPKHMFAYIYIYKDTLRTGEYHTGDFKGRTCLCII